MLSGQEARIRTADRFLRTARFLFDNGYYDDSISRAYYAIYHMAVAIQAVKANSIRKRWNHDELHKAFFDNFCKRGFLFSIRDGEAYSDLMIRRVDSDYHMKTFNRKTAHRLLSDCEALVEKMRKALENA